jgi:hypothetical protein
MMDEYTLTVQVTLHYVFCGHFFAVYLVRSHAVVVPRRMFVVA